MTRPMLATVYGASKTGKTTFATSQPHTVLLDLEDGSFAVDATGCKIIPIHSWQDLVQAIEKVKNLKGLKCLALDSLTVAHSLALQYVSKGPANTSLLTIRPNATLQQFGQANELIKQLILQLRSFPFDVICTAQERVQYLDNAGADLGGELATKEAVIDLPAGARSFAVMYSDVLGYSHIANTERGAQYRLWLQPLPGIVAGMRGEPASKLAYLSNPTLARLHKYMGLTTNKGDNNA